MHTRAEGGGGGVEQRSNYRFGCNILVVKLSENKARTKGYNSLLGSGDVMFHSQIGLMEHYPDGNKIFNIYARGMSKISTFLLQQFIY